MKLKIDQNLLERFESGLNPQQIDRSEVPATILGYGEISSIFKIEGCDRVAFKRMPLFTARQPAEEFIRLFREYNRLLEAAGLNLLGYDAVVIQVPERPVTVYIAQDLMPEDRFGHKLIQVCEPEACRRLLDQVAEEASKVWQYNAESGPDVELALDGQISNWVRPVGGDENRLIYIDTSTPLFRLSGVEQLDPEPLLKGAPGFLRWILRWLFLDDVMNRYYDARQVFMDIAANLYKEQRKDLIPLAVEVFNRHLPEETKPLTERDVKAYYRLDKLIWTLFLAFRRMDRWLTTKLLRRRYEFILPGKIRR